MKRDYILQYASGRELVIEVAGDCDAGTASIVSIITDVSDTHDCIKSVVKKIIDQ